MDSSLVILEVSGVVEITGKEVEASNNGVVETINQEETDSGAKVVEIDLEALGGSCQAHRTPGAVVEVQVDKEDLQTGVVDLRETEARDRRLMALTLAHGKTQQGAASPVLDQVEGVLEEVEAGEGQGRREAPGLTTNSGADRRRGVWAPLGTVSGVMTGQLREAGPLETTETMQVVR